MPLRLPIVDAATPRWAGAATLGAADGDARVARSDAFRVALVSMPFGQEMWRPSIQLGLLRAIAEQSGFPTDTYHLYVDLAARLTPQLHDALIPLDLRMTGEWLFSVAAFGSEVPSDDEAFFAAFPEEIEGARRIGKDAAFLSSLRHEVLPAYIDDCLRSTDWGQYRVVGFSSTFQQNVASLALARRIKERFPSVLILFGGANWEGEMGPEYFRSFPCVDYAVVGEADLIFPELLGRLANEERLDDLGGVLWRDQGQVRFIGQAAPVEDLDALPTPDYSEYFERSRRLGLMRDGQFLPALPFESARGCWWGQKQHCTFCGLNGRGMGYRAKSAERVLSQLGELARKHRVYTFYNVDNILSMKYLDELFPLLYERKLDFRFWYEVKANLTLQQLRTMHRGGVRSIQPGIESMSTHVLKLMHKGCTMLQNVRLLKWATYFEMAVSWNVIWGFPGETEGDYQQQLDVLKRIPHLHPPAGCGRIWLERFAPYFADQENFPVSDVRAEASYRYAYPSHVDLDKAAYFFNYTMGETVDCQFQEETRECLRQWRRQWSAQPRPSLLYWRTPDTLFIEDRREPGQGQIMTVEEPWASAYEYSGETMRTVRQVREHLQAVAPGPDANETEVADVLEDFCRNGMMLSEDGKYLSLALPMNPNW